MQEEQINIEKNQRWLQKRGYHEKQEEKRNEKNRINNGTKSDDDDTNKGEEESHGPKDCQGKQSNDKPARLAEILCPSFGTCESISIQTDNCNGGRLCSATSASNPEQYYLINRKCFLKSSFRTDLNIFSLITTIDITSITESNSYTCQCYYVFNNKVQVTYFYCNNININNITIIIIITIIIKK